MYYFNLNVDNSLLTMIPFAIKLALFSVIRIEEKSDMMLQITPSTKVPKVSNTVLITPLNVLKVSLLVSEY